MARGDRVPDLVLPRPDGRRIGLYASVDGRPVALVFLPAAPPPETAAWLAGLSETGCALYVVGAAAIPPLPLPDGTTCLSDADGRGGAAYGVTPQHGGALFLDPNLRVRGLGPVAPRGDDPVLEAARGWRPGPELRDTQPAPVLVIPDVLDPATCRRLIERWQQENAPSGVFQTVGGQARMAIDPAQKVRRDHHVRDRALVDELAWTVGSRVMPEIDKAFCFKATRFEEFKIVCYDAAEAGHFTVHRDNLTPGNAHRRFAMTLNLNAGEYEGGDLRFPEYGNALYAPPSGGAVVFSCSLLHEARRVTKGRRFVLLSFLFGEAEAEAIAKRRAQG